MSASPPHSKSRAARLLRFARNLARWGLPRRSLLFGRLSLGDDLLCTAVLREARLRGQPFAMMTARPELFVGNSDPTRLLPIDDDYVAGIRRLGAKVIQPYYAGTVPGDETRDLFPSRHIIAEMCALAGLHGEIALRPWLTLSETEHAAGQIFPQQITLHSSGLAAAVPNDAKEWGPARFATVARLLAPHSKLIQLGSPKDPPLPVDVDLRGKTNLREAAAILASSRCFIGLEGFLAHLARAVDCPGIVVLGGRAPVEIVGYSANRNFTASPACSPCALRRDCPHDLICMTAISPEAVAATALDILAHATPGPLAHATAILP